MEVQQSVQLEFPLYVDLVHRDGDLEKYIYVSLSILALVFITVLLIACVNI